MDKIEGYPAQSMHGQFLSWGREDKYAPALVPSEQSLNDIRQTQEALIEIAPDATIVAPEKLHATLLYCPPRYIFETVCKARGKKPDEVDPSREAMYYVDISNALSSSLIFSPKAGSVAVESLDTFDEEAGSVALRLTENAYLSEWRHEVRALMMYNLRTYGWVDDATESALKHDPKLRWLFQDSSPHISIAHNVHTQQTTLGSIGTASEVEFNGLIAASPEQFVGLNAFSFDPEGAFDLPPSS